MFKRLALIIFSGFLSFNVYAGSSYTGTIRAVVCHAQSITSICQVEVNGVVQNETCGTSNWKYTLEGATIEGKNMLSILLAAQMSGKEVVMAGTGCSPGRASEDLRHVYIVTP